MPKSPGVYIFTGACGRVLYVGQSKNLRERLSYYKNAQPEREPKRIVRLVHETTRIEIECCESAAAARLRELALIGQHRPRFNVANTLSPTFTFFGFQGGHRRCVAGEGSFTLRIAMKPERRRKEVLVGAFRNRSLCARAFCAIARTVAATARKIESAFGFPASIHARATEWDGFGTDWRESVEVFVRGEQAEFLEYTTVLATGAVDPFLRKVFEADLLTLNEFFLLAQQMREARLFHDLPVLSNEALQVSAWQMRHPETEAAASVPLNADPQERRLES